MGIALSAAHTTPSTDERFDRKKIQALAMGLKLHGIPMSTCTARVLSCAYEKDAAVELVPVNLQTGEHKSPDYLATKNPFGQIPALVDGDLTLFESRAINRYIAGKYQGQGTDLLHHANAKKAALVNVWIEVESQNYNPPISAIVYEIAIKPMFGQTPDEEVVAANTAKLEKVLDVYEERLSKSKYLAGDDYSLADLHHQPYTFYLMNSPKAELINCRRHVKAWWENISCRPAFKKVVAGMAPH